MLGVGQQAVVERFYFGIWLGVKVVGGVGGELAGARGVLRPASGAAPAGWIRAHSSPLPWKGSTIGRAVSAVNVSSLMALFGQQGGEDVGSNQCRMAAASISGRSCGPRASSTMFSVARVKRLRVALCGLELGEDVVEIGLASVALSGRPGIQAVQLGKSA